MYIVASSESDEGFVYFKVIGIQNIALNNLQDKKRSEADKLLKEEELKLEQELRYENVRGIIRKTLKSGRKEEKIKKYGRGQGENG